MEEARLGEGAGNLMYGSILLPCSSRGNGVTCAGVVCFWCDPMGEHERLQIFLVLPHIEGGKARG